MQLTQKLLSYLHRIFDKDPGQFLALRLSYAGGMTWTIADAMLTTTVTGGPGQPLTVDLTQYTLGRLYAFLAAQPGYRVIYGDRSTLSLLSARVLVDGTNDIAKSNGDHLYGYTSVLWSYLESQAQELQAAEAQIVEMLKQMSTKTAQAEWLDEIGGYYAVPRLQGELDASYGPRIIAEVLRPRGNNVAMEAAIKVYTGQSAKVTDVTLYGATFPLYDGTITHDGTYHHDAVTAPLYGLFDVEYGYDLLNGADIAQFQQIVVDLIDRLRDAGTHLRSVLLRASNISDAFTAPTDTGAIPWGGALILNDTLTAPDDSQFDVATTLASFADTLAAQTDDVSLTIDYNYQHNGIRRYDGTIAHMGGQTVGEAL